MKPTYNGLSDCHLHTFFSTDSEQSPEGTIKKAIELGLSRICITDHIDLDFPEKNPDGSDAFVFDPKEYFDYLTPLKEKYSSQIDIRIGVELGLLPYLSERNQAFINSAPFDFVIGSSHLVDGQDPYWPAFWEGKDSEKLIIKYYEGILNNLDAFSDFDVYGHLDYINRYIVDKTYVYDENRFMELFEAILKKLISMGKGIEINTGALAKGLSNPNPSPSIIKLYHDLKGEIISFGSDSHNSANIGYDFLKAKQIVLDAGFKYYTTFKGRKPEFWEL